MEVFVLKRIIVITYTIYMVLISITLAIDFTPGMCTAEVYFVDSQMLRLVSVETEFYDGSSDEVAEQVLDELICGRDYNKKIKRMIPLDYACLSVRVKQNTAIVDISNINTFPDGKVNEILVIYQIVNSLTSIDGIDKVEFTIEGKEQKNFKGFIDMRETFIPDYYV